jgi:hypothetical protein
MEVEVIIGAHAVLFSTNSDADRTFLRDVLGLAHVDAGHGWLIFGLPAAEIAIHPSDRNDVHEIYLMCDDVEALVAEMGAKGITCTPPQSQGWGVLTHLTLPGGGKLGVYQPRHAHPKAARRASTSRPKRAKRAGPKSAARSPIGRGTKGGKGPKRRS